MKEIIIICTSQESAIYYMHMKDEYVFLMKSDNDIIDEN